MFQSQTGSITSVKSYVKNALAAAFQSQTGSITRTQEALNKVNNSICFNPKLVQLQAKDYTYIHIPCKSFNPKLVQLRESNLERCQ